MEDKKVKLALRREWFVVFFLFLSSSSSFLFPFCEEFRSLRCQVFEGRG